MNDPIDVAIVGAGPYGLSLGEPQPWGVRLDRLSFLDGRLRETVRTLAGSPDVGRDFPSSVPGLYFVGPAVAPAFGPVMRFVYGAACAALNLRTAVGGRSSRRWSSALAPPRCGSWNYSVTTPRVPRQPSRRAAHHSRCSASRRNWPTCSHGTASTSPARRMVEARPKLAEHVSMPAAGAAD